MLDLQRLSGFEAGREKFGVTLAGGGRFAAIAFQAEVIVKTNTIPKAIEI